MVERACNCRDAFVTFSAGARGCIGRYAATAEGTALLARVVSKYRIEPPAGEADKWKLREGETEFQRRERIYEASQVCVRFG